MYALAAPFKVAHTTLAGRQRPGGVSLENEEKKAALHQRRLL
jgi:hypothetical protein